MCVRVCLHICSLSLKKNISKTAYKDHNLKKKKKNLLRNQKIFKKKKNTSRSSFTEIFLKNKYLFEKSY